MFLIKNSKSPNYQIVYFVDGKRTTVSTKTSSEKEANDFLRNFQISQSHSQEAPQTTSKTFQLVYLEKFKDEYVKYTSAKNSEDYIRSIKLSFNQLIEFFGNVPLTEINVRSLDHFITTTFSRTPRGAHLYFRTLKAAFSKAVAWDYIKENPLKKIKFPRIPKNHPVFISSEEFKIILSQTQEEFLKELFAVAFNTGMRLGELVNLQWDWINFDDSTIKIKCSDEFQTKSKKERIIPINSNIKEILFNVEPAKRKKYIFTNKKGFQLNKDFVTKKFKKAVRDTGLNDAIHFHTLRHSFASMLVQKGVSLYVVKELLGHEDLATTQIYAHLQNQNLRDAVNLI